MIRRGDPTVLREQLLERRGRLRRALARARDDQERRRRAVAGRDPCAWLDATDDAEAEHDPGLRAAVIMAAELQSVERALGRIETAERWDRCVRCGASIGAERLELLPHTVYCRDCA